MLQCSWLSELSRWPAIDRNAVPGKSEIMSKLRRTRTFVFAGLMRESISERRCGYVIRTE